MTVTPTPGFVKFFALPRVPKTPKNADLTANTNEALSFNLTIWFGTTDARFPFGNANL
ncbi:hypothetical protein [Coleofasciculus sp. FACHB-64]|uniref:hypothetical protein n=1 Tax=Cyanophyceae TaxID=3028117 RepID=UPI001686F6F1|nr:hypothetical protein [Coleofasciculus sp. FACHB-64]MBD1837872.1 hypothetical protein [Coleofasciculus sp. FACHB-501]